MDIVKHESKWDTLKDNARQFLTRLSRAFMLPIAILPIAGLLLGIGGAIGANTTQTQLANVFKGMSEVVFANLPILFGASVAMTFTKVNKVYAVFILIIAFLVFNSVQTAFIHYNTITAGGKKVKKFHDIFWIYTNSNLKYMVGSNLGVKSLQTSIFGGIVIGGIVAYAINKWSQYELPTALSFFSGIRLVPILIIPIATLLAVLFLSIWPVIGIAISAIGKASNSAPAGLDGLAYGMLGRALMPFGLHHIVIAMAWQTPLGGQFTSADIANAATKLGVENTTSIKYIIQHINEAKFGGVITGDQNMWNFLNGLPYNRLPINAHGGSQPIFEWFSNNVGVYAGRFTQDYPIYLGACMGIGLAIIFTADKGNRKQIAAITGSAMLVAFLTGITEPLEFSFLFIAPLFYYVIYVPLSGLAYMLMKDVGAHVGVGFARGFIDYIIYGAVPIAKGTKFYWALPLSLGFGIVSFFSFYFMIKKFDWSTPGRGNNEIKLITKADYKSLKEKSLNENSKDEIEQIVLCYGGIANITDVTSCATRLRITVSDISLVNDQGLKELGAFGVIKKGKSTQAIFGGRASILDGKIKDKYNLD